MEEHPNIKSRFVFISHSGPDTWVAKQIAREIEARGATPFLDEAQVDAGADFLLRGLWTGHTFGLKLELRGDAESLLWHYCSGSRRQNCKRGQVYPCS